MDLAACNISSLVVYLPTDSLKVDDASSRLRPLLIKMLEAAPPPE